MCICARSPLAHYIHVVAALDIFDLEYSNEPGAILRTSY